MANRKRGVSYVQQDEPSFITQFKQKVGYKEGPTVDTKRTELERDEGEDGENELPTVVVLKKGDLSQEEVDQIRQANPDAFTDEDTDNTESLPNTEENTDSKIKFKKPTKRCSDSNDLNITSKKKKDSEKAKEIEKKQKKSESKDKVKNASLLSFDEEEDDD